MKRFTLTMLVGACVMALALSACNGKKEETAAAPQAPAETTQAAPQGTAPTMGTVAETMNSGGYTYALLNTGDAEVWVAAPEVQIAVGDTVGVMGPAPMPGYHSTTLDRTFEMLYFASAIVPGGGMGQGGAAGMGGTRNVVAGQEGIQVEKLADGVTVGELFEKKDAMANQPVKLRGKVVKFSGGIMGTNWMHIQDGTGGEGTSDLTVTSDNTAEVGQTVVIEGVLTVDKDIGSGYFYPVIIEGATITVE